MASTVNRNYPKPVASNNISDDVSLLQSALDLVDGDIQTLLDGLAGTASVNHSHTITDIAGLQTALGDKASASHVHALDNLSDVSGMAGAATGYLMVKTATDWQPSSPAAALGAHGHTIAEITDLTNVLNAKATTVYVDSAVANLVDSSPAVLDTINELAASLGDDPNFAVTMIDSLAGKADASTTQTALNLKQNISGLATAVAGQVTAMTDAGALTGTEEVLLGDNTKTDVQAIARVTKQSFYTQQLPASAVGVTLLFLNTGLNEGGNFNPANGRYTASEAGIHEFFAEILFSTDAASGGWKFRKNGVALGSQKITTNSAAPALYQLITGGIVIHLNVGDYVDIITSGTALLAIYPGNLSCFYGGLR